MAEKTRNAARAAYGVLSSDATFFIALAVLIILV